ncbi:MAG: YqjK family protein [Burkholderiales bacterium]
MNTQLATVVRRRQELVARAAAQRAEFEVFAERWRGPLAVADAAYRLGQAVRRHPAISAVAVAMLVRTPRHRVLVWSGALLTLWELYQAFREQCPRRDQPAEPQAGLQR